MKFGKLHIQNFLTIGEADLSLADRGLVLIQGRNEDDSSASSNGAGKSSIVDALSWCLFGVTARGVSGDRVVNRHAGKDCCVRVYLHDDDGSIYRIERHRKHKTGKNAVTLERMTSSTAITDLTQGTDKLTQDKIEQVLGCSYEVFCAAVYSGQERMPDLPGMTDKQLKVLVEEAAGVTLLEAAYGEARARLGKVKDEIALAQKDVERWESQLLREREHHDQVKSDIDKWEVWRTEELVRMDKLHTELLDQNAKVENDLDAYDLGKISADLAKVKARIDGVSVERAEERVLLDEVSGFDRRLATLKATLNGVRTRYDAEKKAAEDIADRVGEPCGECGKSYCEHDLAEARRLAVAKAKNTASDYSATKTHLEALMKDAQSARERLEAHRASMTDISKFSSLSDALNAKLRQAEALRLRLEQGRSEGQKIRETIKKTTATENPHKVSLGRAQSAIEDAERALEHRRKGVEELEGQLQVHELVCKVFSPAGVRAHILDEVTPFLNAQTAKYLGTLSDGNITASWTTLVKTAKGDLKEKFSIEVEHAEGGEGFEAISGGEKRKVRIACALALQDLVARRATKPIELFIGDEIDDALDDPGLERLTMILEEKAKDRGTVLVISHSDISAWISNQIIVTKKGKVSTVVEAIV